ncbi:nitrogen fixation protein NifQ [uncultured Cohaesibacter sp.]|uniref:nitrogen fixation protein NifQ n=1 Tax=uncultured Cohaesibacter sp. TaxID=1002546 RepID=UPI0029C858DB|nr:nitrogen fixation protein NifQ [uncultured Cohaesibacter sp.]
MYRSNEDRTEHSASFHQALYQRLMSHAVKEDPNAGFLAEMIASWIAGEGALPRFMGLEKDAYDAMLETFFPGMSPLDAGDRNDIEPERGPELEDVKALLLTHRNNSTDAELWVAQIVASGCMGSDHLWSDLGLFSRKNLGIMLKHNFTALAVLNDKNMRWKKFFYRQLCAKEGFIMCRSPSCETCSEYKACFAEDGMFD